MQRRLFTVSPLDAFRASCMGDSNESIQPPRKIMKTDDKTTTFPPFSSSSSPPSSSSTSKSFAFNPQKEQESYPGIITKRQDSDRVSKRSKRYSEQSFRSQFIRASQLHSKHISSLSYPTYTPSSIYPQKHHLIIWEGITWEMQSPRRNSRPASSGSATSYESRSRSPLSNTSSIDDISSIASDISSFLENSSTKSQSRSSVHGGNGLAGKRSYTDPMVPAYNRYGSDMIESRPPSQTTLNSPQRLRQEPTSWTKYVSHPHSSARDSFPKLPEEILLVILRELKKLHLCGASLSCATCCMRDLHNIGLSSKKWWSASKVVLYEDIQLVGNDSVIHTKKKFKVKYGTRLRLLRRTLRSQPDLANYVKVLKVPSIPEAAKTKQEQDEYLDLVASIIMACPNLERFPGFYQSYDHEYNHYFHALSTRSKLIEKVWIIEPSPRQRRFGVADESETPVIVPGPLHPEQSADFLNFHSNFPRLQTLVLHCNAGGMIDSSLFTKVLQQLPSLRELYISCFPSTSFNDENLISLPPLKSLRLDSLPGVTSNGLATYASLSNSAKLTSLTLINLPLRSLSVLARLFAHLGNLKSFTLSQGPSPLLDRSDIFLHPYLASRSLENLHWEITNPDDDRTSDILAKSIAFSGFPSLTSIRAPTDFNGSLQKLCKPKARIELPGDKYRRMGVTGNNGPNRASTMPILQSPNRTVFSRQSNRDSLTKSSNSSSLSLPYDTLMESGTKHEMMSLATARQLAQLRIESASTPQFDIIIWDDKGQFVERYKLGAFIGKIESKVVYNLKPDLDGSDEAVVGVETLIEGNDDREMRDGCTGSWNIDLETKAGRSQKGKDRWFHTERERWREVGLDTFF